MTDHQNSVSVALSSDKFEENSALISDLEQQIRNSMDSLTTETIINTFHALRYTLDLELAVALRNSVGYLQSAGVTDEERINEVLLSAVKDTLIAFQRSRTTNIVKTITARAEKNKAMLTVFQQIETSSD